MIAVRCRPARLPLRVFSLLVSVWWLNGPARAQLCETVTDAATRYTVCTVDVRHESLALFSRDDSGQLLATFDRLAANLARAHRTLAFAMNAGMFEADLSPVGLLVVHGRTLHPTATRDGTGNFFWKPNGVFFFGEGEVGVMETGAFVATGRHPAFATQSGPMLVIGGRIHPGFRPEAASRKVRNGVGVRDAHTAVFAISEEPVSFHRFAALFRDRLRCADSLFLDGTVSTLYDPALDRTRQIAPLGPMVGVTAPAP